MTDSRYQIGRTKAGEGNRRFGQEGRAAAGQVAEPPVDSGMAPQGVPSQDRGLTTGANAELRSAKPSGGAPEQILVLSGKSAQDSKFAACGDGRHFVAHSARSQGENIWRFDSDGSNPLQLTYGYEDTVPSCSPDGRWVVYQSAQAGNWTIWKVSIDGGQPVQLTNKLSEAPAISPDGKQIAFAYQPDAKRPAVLAIIPFDGGPPIKTFKLPDTAVPVSTLWTPDGRALTFVDERQGVGNLWNQPVSGGPPKPLTNFKSEEIFWYAWSRDGRLALSRGAVSHDVVTISNFLAR